MAGSACHRRARFGPASLFRAKNAAQIWNVAVWIYIAAAIALAGIAEILGLGGVPVRALTLANSLFTLLLFGLIVVVLSRFVGPK